MKRTKKQFRETDPFKEENVGYKSKYKLKLTLECRSLQEHLPPLDGQLAMVL